MEFATIKTKPSLTNTLKSLPIGQERFISIATFEVAEVRKRCSQLKKDGFEFTVNAPATINGCFVTRRK